MLRALVAAFMLRPSPLDEEIEDRPDRHQHAGAEKWGAIALVGGCAVWLFLFFWGVQCPISSSRKGCPIRWARPGAARAPTLPCFPPTPPRWKSACSRGIA